MNKKSSNSIDKTIITDFYLSVKIVDIIQFTEDFEMDYKSAFMREMDRQGIRYSDDGEFRVSVSYSGDFTNSIKINVIFDKDGEGLVALRCWSFGSIPSNAREYMLERCNKLNAEYRWVKFYIDNDGNLSVGMDAVVDIDSVGKECVQLVKRMVSIYDDAYPTLIKRCIWY